MSKLTEAIGWLAEMRDQYQQKKAQLTEIEREITATTLGIKRDMLRRVLDQMKIEIRPQEDMVRHLALKEFLDTADYCPAPGVSVHFNPAWWGPECGRPKYIIRIARRLQKGGGPGEES